LKGFPSFRFFCERTKLSLHASSSFSFTFHNCRTATTYSSPPPLNLSSLEKDSIANLKQSDEKEREGELCVLWPSSCTSKSDSLLDKEENDDREKGASSVEEEQEEEEDDEEE
jgi:hypothetical protein